MIVPALFLVKLVLVVFVDLLTVVRCRGKGSNYVGVLWLLIAACIVSQVLPMKQVEAKVLAGKVVAGDIAEGLLLTQRILAGNIAMLAHGVMTYLALRRELIAKD